MPKAKLVVPLKGAHIKAALAVARIDQEKFRRDEMKWIENNFSFYHKIITSSFFNILKEYGAESPVGGMFLAGTCLGNFAVRLCSLEPQYYESVRLNFRKNIGAAESPFRQSDQSDWGLEKKINDVFGDPDITTEIMSIVTPESRVAAALAIGHLCLEQMPPVLAELSK